MSFRLCYLAPVALLAATLSAHAGTVHFGSYAGTNPGFDNGATRFGGTTNGTSTNSAIASTIALTDNVAGTQFVTFGNGNQSAGTTDYFTTLGGNLANYTGTLTVVSDDTASIYLLNASGRTLIGLTAYNTPTTFSNINFGSSNVLEFDVTNVGGATAIDFGGTAATAATPEPSSLILLGTGVLGVAGAMRRRFFPRA